jgi:hypothetical protein
VSPEQTHWYYLRRPRIHMGWIYSVITHDKKGVQERSVWNL